MPVGEAVAIDINKSHTGAVPSAWERGTARIEVQNAIFLCGGRAVGMAANDDVDISANRIDTDPVNVMNHV